MLTVYNPYDLSVIQEVPVDTKEQVMEKLAAAHDLFQDKKRWLPAYERAAILEKVVEIMKAQKEELAKIAASEGGKPWKDTLVEVNRAINGVQLAKEHMGVMAGEQIPMGHTASSANRMAFTVREPIGVVASVSAFNHPLNLTIHQTVPAIAVGAPVIIKPARTTPLSALRFAQILYEAGLPKEYCQVTVCDTEAATALVTDKRVHFFSFIGSAAVGWKLRSQLAAGTRCALEHGGVAPVIVEQDAQLEHVVPDLVKGGFYHAGQVCVSVQRIYAHKAIVQDLAQRMVQGVKQLKVGSQLDPNTDVGPLISPKEVDRIEEWVQEAVQKGAKLLHGGNRIGKTCFEPTILLNPPPEAMVAKAEVFGPVAVIFEYENLEEAIMVANDSEFHFQAAVYTQNLNKALYAVEALNATAVMVNDHTAFRVDWMPFGGRDSSGMGLGGIQYSMHDMTREKLMVFKKTNY
jgi:acyl-CoA reductase-like NAD-dependent aldehyde dehydrogenase